MEECNKKQPLSLDALDEKILRELQLDAKKPLRDIAAKLKSTAVTVMKRIKRMEQQGVIKGYGVSINYEKLGYGITVVIEVRISKGMLFELERKIAKSPHVYAVYDTTGEFDATLLARFTSTGQLDRFVKRIQKEDFVERTHTKLVLNTIKEGHIQL